MADITLPEELLQDVKDYLDIRWDDETTDKKLTGIILRGMKYLDKVAGEECDYSQEDKPRELLFEYCRYARSNALEAFQDNYLSELLTLQMDKEVERLEKAANADP